jgi:hypothetical protein
MRGAAQLGATGRFRLAAVPCLGFGLKILVLRRVYQLLSGRPRICLQIVTIVLQAD